MAAGGDEYKRIPASEEAAEEAKAHVSMRRLVSEAWPERWTIICATVAMFLGALCNLAIPALFGRVIDSLTPGTDGETVDNAAQLRGTIVGLIIVALLSACFTFAQGYLFSAAGERVVARLRNKLFVALMQQEVGWYDQTRVGELVSRLGSDTSVLKDAATSNISMALRWSASVIGSVIYLFAVSWKLTMVMLAVVPPLAIAARYYGGYVRDLSKATRQALAEATEVAEESMSAIRTVRSFNNEARQTREYTVKVDETLRLGIASALAFAGFTGGAAGFASLVFVGILAYGGSLVLSGELTSGELTSFLLYAITIGGSLAGLAGLFGTMMTALGANDRVFQLLDRQALVSRDEGEPVPSITGDVSFQAVSFAYPSRPDAVVLRDVTLHIRAGSVAALTGPSGAGKSSIINLIEKFYLPSHGRVSIDGRNIANMSGSQLRRHIGVVLQEPTLFYGSITDNIKFAREDASQEQVVAAARAANAHEFIEGFADGYATIVGERGVRLSGGQKQRIAIARAVLQDPRILLLDEATSALDAESEHLVKQALERLMRGRTTLVVAHRLSTVRQADVVFVIDGGRVVGQGSHDVLMQSNELYAQLVKRQMQGSDSSATVAAEASDLLMEESGVGATAPHANGASHGVLGMP